MKKTVVVYWEEPVIVARALTREPSKSAKKRLKKHGWRFATVKPREGDPYRKPKSIFDILRKLLKMDRRIIVEKASRGMPAVWMYKKETHIRKKRLKVNPNMDVDMFVMEWADKTGRKVVWYDYIGEDNVPIRRVVE